MDKIINNYWQGIFPTYEAWHIKRIYYYPIITSSGSHYIFGIPGSNMGLIHSLMEDNDIRTILTKHECGAAFMLKALEMCDKYMPVLIDVVIDPEEVK
ncbi:MAG: thiamine pyrophosphate-binding protein [candidate division WOR-3 bacterium]